jgi:hypothetical protein
MRVDWGKKILEIDCIYSHRRRLVTNTIPIEKQISVQNSLFVTEPLHVYMAGSTYGAPPKADSERRPEIPFFNTHRVTDLNPKL